MNILRKEMDKEEKIMTYKYKKKEDKDMFYSI